MSLSEPLSELAEHPAQTLTSAAEVLAAGIADPDRIPDVELRTLMANVVRLYAAKAEIGMRTPLPPDAGGVTVTETMLTVSDLLHAVNVEVFELSMWQAMSGNCIAPHRRIDAP
jgi:hypothetical protein